MKVRLQVRILKHSITKKPAGRLFVYN